MRIMIITVAGISSRFSQSIGRPCLKCLYYKTDIKESLLYRMISQNKEIDKYVIVGGFQYEELRNAIEQFFGEFWSRIVLVQNEHYEEYGSGYSLYLGLKAARDMDYEEMVFAEGDLWIDEAGFKQLWKTPGNVITCNREAILADRSVAFYYDRNYRIHYIFDTTHVELEITEPFLGIFNSGQIWKFAQQRRIAETMRKLSQEDWKQTNLRFIQQYFGGLGKEEYEIVTLQNWTNCNTVEDFEKAAGMNGEDKL